MNLRNFDLSELTPKETDLSQIELKKGDIVKIKKEWLDKGEEDNFHVVMEASYCENNSSIYLSSICDYNLKAKFPQQMKTPIKYIQDIVFGNLFNLS